MRTKLLIALGIALLAAFAGCTSSSTGVTLPPLPAWQTPADPTPIPVQVLCYQTQLRYPAARVSAQDDVYTRVSRAWLDEYLRWTWEAARAAGVRYTPQSFDCEDFALGFYFFASLSASKAGQRAAPCIARLVIEWDAGARHELIGVVTDAGLFVVEPQPDAGPFRVWPLETFPRKILAITYGDASP